jgi:hypothetical protein
MAKNRFTKYILIILGMVLLSGVYGQCKERFVTDIGGGATITNRIKIPFIADDCVEIFTNTDPTVFLFDSSWNIGDMIKIENDFY